jgi:hypothetical protein
MDIRGTELPVVRHMHVLRRCSPIIANDDRVGADQALWLQTEFAEMAIERDYASAFLKEAIDERPRDKQDNPGDDLTDDCEIDFQSPCPVLTV